MTDPYKVLGVSPDDSDEDIKKAYRALARKYHPDKYADTDLADLASEKMKEVNAAYEEIQKIRASGAGARGGAYSSAGSRNSGSSGAYGGAYTSSQGGSRLYTEVRRMINSGDIEQAEKILLGVNSQDRGAEWNFLMGCIAVRRGRYVDAQRYIDVACGLDPYNDEYIMARERLRARANGYGGAYGSSPQYSGCCNGCDFCTTLLCADCLCRCCGGGYR